MNTLEEVVNKSIVVSETTEADVFVRYFGYSKLINVDIHSKGFDADFKPDICAKYSYTDKRGIIETPYKTINVNNISDFCLWVLKELERLVHEEKEA